MEKVVEQVLAAARERLAERLTLDDLAQMAMFSKFHFARVFRRVTGVSPRRFLYALRLQEAERLLITTQLSVAEVSHSVGYSSVGTFTSRFTASVGVSPAAYRRLRGDISDLVNSEPPDPSAPGQIDGRLEPLGSIGEPVTVGLFATSFPEGRPVRYQVLPHPGEWSFRHVPAGRWYVLAASAPSGGGAGARDAGVDPMLMSMSEAVRVSERLPVAHVTMRLRPMRSIDPPILVGLADLHRRTAPRAAPGMVTA